MQKDNTWNILTIDDNWHNSRLDVFLEVKLEISRSKAKKLIKNGLVLINERIVKKAGEKLKKGGVVKVFIPAEEENLELTPLELDIPVLYEDEYLAVIEKPAGLVVHPASGHRRDTLVNALIGKFEKLSIYGGMERAGIVHRLDKDTSGVMVITKDERCHELLSRMFKEKKVTKVYIAITRGEPQKLLGIIDKPIGRHPVDRKKMTIRGDGREAMTIYKLIKRNPPYNLVLARILTGRTHQIRVHFKSINMPVIGDAAYGKDLSLIKRQALHSSFIALDHPIKGQKIVIFSPPPIDIVEVMLKLDLYLKEEELEREIMKFIEETKNLYTEPSQVSS
ncbi:MAG: RluA family pseudouridine synthase [Thermosulfidibacteraceae bacterium]|jgi:23S rRNA pseudouridine1911/1915/1917 synthase